MTQNSSEPRESLAPGVRESNAAGEADAIVGQLHRRRDAASRCEPFDCGHRDPLDCTAAGCGEESDSQSPSPNPDPDVDPDALTELWANAKAAWSARDFPKYGSRAWIELGPDDPRRLASVLEAAEMWRKYGDEEELVAWLKNLGRSPNLIEHRSRAELDAAARPKPPHQLRATPGWPPIAMPGQPGRYLYARQEKAA
jgi:hypothetical protein